MGTISKSHIIEDESKKIIEKILSLKNNFILRSLIPDYHVDYLVELVRKQISFRHSFGNTTKRDRKIRFKE